MAKAQTSFTPPHCPHPDCDSHANPTTWRFSKKGFFLRESDGRRVQRYRCSRCVKSFSTQTFSTTYWMKRPELQEPLFWHLVGCSGYRQIARAFDVSHSTIQRHTERLGRHLLLFHERLRPRRPAEGLVLDGFRSFESGQYWPYDLNLLVGRSHYIYGFNEAELRRSGSQTPGQKRHRERLEGRHGRPDPQATRKAVEELVARVVPPGASIEIDSDEHRAYPQAFRRLMDREIVHHQTSSKALRTASNPLFPVNLADLLLRHSGSEHKRETIGFAKRRQNAMYRAAIFVAWRNYMKHTSERRRTPPPAVALGITRRRLTLDDLLARRLFPWRSELRGWLRRCYYGQIATRRIPKGRVHALRLAV